GFHGAGRGGGCVPADGVALDDWRVYDTALSEVQLLQIANGNAPWPEGLPMPKQKISAFVDTNSVLRLGYEIPEEILIGRDGERRLYAKGVLAQCGIGGEKRFELAAGGQFALGAGGFVFDSNYARARTNEVVFSGGALLSFEPTFVKSGAPIRLSGTSRLIVNRQLLVRASFEGDGNLVKTGEGVLGLQYPCDGATGRLTVASESTLVLGPAATWGGTIELAKGATLKCVSANVVGKIVKAPGARVIESQPGATNVGPDAFPQPTTGYRFRHMQKERMGRGVYAVRQTEKEVMIGWRYKSSDPTNIAFNVYANGRRLNGAPIADVTYYRTPWTGKTTKYEVRAVLGAREAAFKVGGSWTLPANAPVGYFDIELTPPPDTVMPDGARIAHIPYDCSIGDLDGDGEYDLVVIWWPTNGGDNSSWHKTGDTWIEGVKLDGTNRSLWKINLGPNIRSGSHYVPVMVADFDGDGRAEVVCRTADGTVDGRGRVIGDAAVDWRKILPGAHILWAHNYVTAFDGATGAAIDSV
ncbi:MAG: VCBS repeat-containing protein, partial [Kiritimatiellae bacterium]|nr:VCBS repeat-containing protein [Kiritimatiellia bacterium]